MLPAPLPGSPLLPSPLPPRSLWNALRLAWQPRPVPARRVTASEHQWVCTCVCPKPEHNSFLVILVTQPFSQLLSFRRTIIILLLEECVWEEHLWDRIQPGLTADFTSQGIKACPPPPSAFPATTTRWQCSAKACCPGSCLNASGFLPPLALSHLAKALHSHSFQCVYFWAIATS